MQRGGSVTDSAAVLAAVLTPAFLRKLDRLHLTVRHSLSTRPGNTPMPRGAQGSGIEVEAYKPYAEGDDLRHLDWNAFGRLDQLLVKTYRAEREAPLHVFVDASASMGFPAADGKLGFAAGLAASLAYISLHNHDPVRIVGISAALPRGWLASPVFRHRRALQPVRDFLVSLHARGETGFAAGMGTALRQQRTPGLAVVLSDFLVPVAEYEHALGELVARRFTVVAARLLGPGERDPGALFHRAQIVDAETGQQRFITLGPDNLSRYHDALAAHLRGVADFCKRCGIGFAVLDTAAGLEQTLFTTFPGLGLVH